jgi:hypothetical protein
MIRLFMTGHYIRQPLQWKKFHDRLARHATRRCWFHSHLW